MRKAFYAILFILFFSLPSAVQAQALNERWVCLKALHCKPAGKIPPGYKDEEFVNCVSVKDGHGAQLSEDPAAPPLANTETYIVECIALDGGQVCTTGNSLTDQKIYGKDNTTIPGYQFLGLYPTTTQPVMSKAGGEIGPYEWKSVIRSSTQHKFLALNYWTPTGGGGVPTGALGALQQGTVDFDFATADKDCVSLKWDPYGRVFDAQTLEPVVNTSVNLLLERDDKSFTSITTADVLGGNIINPQKTLEDGVFSFVVDDGTYKLEITNPNYTFPVADLNQLNPNYSKIYSDIYPAATGEEIVQKGEIQHRDIPLIGVDGYISVTLPKMMEYFYDVLPVSKKAIIQGKVSHPFTRIIAYSVKPSASDSAETYRYRQAGEIQADKLGNFKLEIDQSNFEPDESFGEIELVKVDLQTITKNNLFKKFISIFDKLVKKVQAVSTTTDIKYDSIRFDPIPTYLEGYAYDNTGKIMPEVTVGVYLTFSNKPYYQTKADEKGYFKITSENLPTMAYEIRYTSPLGAVVKITTTKFINQNQKYLTDNKIDLYTYKNSLGKTIVKPTTTPPADSLKNPTGQQKKPISPRQTLSNNLLIIAGFIVLFILLIVFLIVFLIKRRSVPPPESDLT